MAWRCEALRLGRRAFATHAQPAATAAAAAAPPAAPPVTLQLYYNRLFFPASAVSKYVPAFVLRAPTQRIRTEVQRSLGATGAVAAVAPQTPDGGAFVTVTTTDPERVRALAREGFRTHWLLKSHHARGFEVLGRPWITDIPRSISRVVDVQPRLPDEDCYELLRPYGRILRIEDGKAVFFAIQDAITACYCAHRIAPVATASGATAPLVRLMLAPRRSYWTRIRGWLGNHSRVVIPAALALLFATTYAIFEPVRVLSISATIKGTMHAVTKYIEWARNSGQRLIVWSPGTHSNGSGSGGGAGAAALDGYVLGASGDGESGGSGGGDGGGGSGGGGAEEESNKILANGRLVRQYINEGTQTFTVVVGPKGSGKEETLDVALEENDLLLEIDCAALRNTSDEGMLRNLASAVGYWPLFLWTNNLFKAAEFGIQGITGQTTTISETTEQQVKRVLTTTSNALRRVALRNATNADANYLETHPDEIPIVVLNKFAGTDPTARVLAQWAGELTRLQIARVIIVTDDTYSYDKTLSEALPNRVFKVVSVEDATPRAAKAQVLRLFSGLAATPEAKQALAACAALGPEFLEPLGGRFTDLQSFGKRLIAGESPDVAMQNLVHAAALEVSQLFLNESKAADAAADGSGSGAWTVEQSWELITRLADSASPHAWLSVPGTLAANPLTSGVDAGTLEALESSGLITLRCIGGRVTGIKPSRPVFRAAFRELLDDPLVANIMASRVAKVGVASAQGIIAKAEAELATLSTIAGLKEVKERTDFVAKQLADAQAKLVQCRGAYAAAVQALAQFKWFEPAEAELEASDASAPFRWFEKNNEPPKSSFE